MVDFHEEKQESKLKELRAEEEENLAEILAQKYGLEYIDLSRVAINTDALRLVAEKDARAANLAVFAHAGKKLKVAILSPNLPATTQVIARLTEEGYMPILYMVSAEGLSRAWERYRETAHIAETEAGLFTLSDTAIADMINTIKSIADAARSIDDILKSSHERHTTRLLEIIAAGALALDASDIHIEPEEGYVRLRYRLDGILTDVTRTDHDAHKLLLSRIKLLSGLKLNVKNRAQDGRFSIRLNEADIEIRTSTLPGAYDEAIVMRILNPEAIAVSMENLGIEPFLMDAVEREIKKPNGMILTTGPTGSGKTTTLYAFLKRIHRPDVKIITIEDPIEYHLPGIVQTQTKKGYTFAEGLRASLRQDPDVIMVGEIRDEETAEIAIQASLTGHLVFSTLHTNNAAGTFPRLIDLGVNPKVISSALNIALAQRLVRVLCGHCRRERKASDHEQTLIQSALSRIPRPEIIPQRQDIVFDAVGCPECHEGFKGRIGVFEGVLTDPAIDSVVRTEPSEKEIQKAALPQKILTMSQDGIIKALKGVTTLGELERVVDMGT